MVLSALPAFCGDLIEYSVMEIFKLGSMIMNTLLQESEACLFNFQIKFKKTVMFESSDGAEIPFEKLHKGLLVERIRKQDGSNRAVVDWYIQSDPPGRIEAYCCSTEGTQEGTVNLVGQCKASTSSVYEVSK
jgi:hypothetical protein